MIYAVVGAGRQGVAAAHAMVRWGGAREVRLLDADAAIASRGARRINDLAGRDVARGGRADAADPSSLAPALRGAHAVLAAVPYRYNVPVARAAIDAGVPFADLGGNTAVTREILALDLAARKAGVALVPDCGLAPGFANTLAVHGMERVDRPRRVRIFCGGLPQEPRPPLGYHLVFHPGGLTNEYSGRAVMLRGGRVVEGPALGELETIDGGELGPLEACLTSGGTSTCPWTFEGQLESYEYKTVRYPGHFEKFRLLADLGFLDEKPRPFPEGRVAPREMLHRMLEEKLSFEDDRDLVFLRVTVEGEGGTIRFTMLDREDPETGFTAMERTTGFPAAAVSVMQARGEVAPGGRPLEVAVPAAPAVALVRSMGIEIREEGP